MYRGCDHTAGRNSTVECAASPCAPRTSGVRVGLLVSFNSGKRKTAVVTLTAAVSRSLFLRSWALATPVRGGEDSRCSKSALWA